MERPITWRNMLVWLQYGKTGNGGTGNGCHQNGTGRK